MITSAQLILHLRCFEYIGATSSTGATGETGGSTGGTGSTGTTGGTGSTGVTGDKKGDLQYNVDQNTFTEGRNYDLIKISRELRAVPVLLGSVF